MPFLFKKQTLTDPLTIGQKLKAARRRKRLRLSDVENRLKIRQAYIEALEADRFGELPGNAYVRQFLRAYATLLRLNPDQLIEECTIQNPTVMNDDARVILPAFVRHPKIFITPKIIASITVIMIVGSIIGYIGYQVERFNRPPILTIEYPVDGSKVVASTVDVVGQTNAGAVVTINGEPVAQQTNGRFNQSIQLTEGVNVLHVMAKNRFNKQTERQISIIRPKDGGQALTTSYFSNHAKRSRI